MKKTTIEWFTIDEKKPFDGEPITEDVYRELLCFIRHDWDTVEVFRYVDNKFVLYVDKKECDFTDSVIYWAYIPDVENGEEVE